MGKSADKFAPESLSVPIAQTVKNMSARHFIYSFIPEVAISLALFCIEPVARAQNAYAFTRIADTNIFSAFRSFPTLNNDGKVAFMATARDGSAGIFAGLGGESRLSNYTTIALNQPPVVIADVGSFAGSRVAYVTVNTDDPSNSYFSSDGVTPQLALGPVRRQFQVPSPVSMNRLGQIPLVGTTNTSLGVAQNGSSAMIYSRPAAIVRGHFELQGLYQSEGVQITDSGNVVFDGFFYRYPVNPEDSIDDLTGILQGSLDGSDPVLLFHVGTDTSDPNNQVTTSVDHLVANNNGDVACLVTISDNSGTFHRLLKIHGYSVSTVIDSRVTPSVPLTTGFNGVTGPIAINDNGTILFATNFKDSEGVLQLGLFSGPDLAKDKVIATGDRLFGSTVKSFGFWRVGFNNGGQIVFTANLSNGNDSIVRADPSDGGTAVEWVGPPDDSAQTVGNWKPANGDTPRVPEETDTISDTAVFDEVGEVIVSAGNLHCSRLIIKNSDLTFHHGVFNIDGTSFDEPSVLVDNGALRLQTGMVLTNNHAMIGLSGLTRV